MQQQEDSEITVNNSDDHYDDSGDDIVARRQIQLHRRENNHDSSTSIVYIIQFTGVPNKANVFSKPLVQRLDHLLDTVEENLPCTLVLTGNGNFFSAGFDIQALTGQPRNSKTENNKNNNNDTRSDLKQKQSQQKQETSSRGQELVKYTWTVLARILVFSAPTITVFNGHAFGLGLFLGLACDHRVMIDENQHNTKTDIPNRTSKQTYLCLPEVSIGLPLGSGFAALAKCKMTPSTLRTSALTGKRYNPKEALKAGLIDAIIPTTSSSSFSPSKGKEDDMQTPTKNNNGNTIIVPAQVMEIAKDLTTTSEKSTLPAIKMELYGETYKKLMEGTIRPSSRL
jgi:enoyl-CoA hydratase/carnithine racemase